VAPTIDDYTRLANVDLSRFATIILYNPSRMDAGDADRIAQWVDGGGGLMIVLGPGFKSAEAMMESGMRSLLPGQVKRQSRRALDDQSVFVSPVIKNHPIWSIFERPIDEIPWVSYPVYRHWDIESLAPDATEIMRFTGSELPAVVDWARGQGRVLVMALPYPEPESTAQSQPWSELFTTTADAWPGFALFLGMSRYLASQNKHPVNYMVESTALLDNNTTDLPKVYELFTPTAEVVRVESADEMVSYSFTKQPGQYRLRGLRPRGPVVRGFSVNIDRNEISLERVVPATLDTALGKSNYRIAKDKDQVQTSLGEGRHGRDLSPFLLIIIAMMVMLEQTMSSRF
jgi:hypothetical protein